MLKKLFDLFRRDIKLIAFALRNTSPDFARHRADLSFQITNARLTRVVANNLLQSLVAETDFFGAQAILADLTRDQITFRNGDLFIIGITGKPNDLHAVKQWTGDRLSSICGGNKKDLR